MPPTPTTQRMGELHEIYLAEVFGGTKTKASGSQWTDPGDGANHHDDPFAFRWDGKSTKGRQIAITMEMVEKIIEQGGSERPALAFRWYGNEALTRVLHDWVACKAVDFSELLAAARESEGLRTELAGVRAAYEAVSQRMDELETLREALQRSTIVPPANMSPEGPAAVSASPGGSGGTSSIPAVPAYIPMLPWTIVHQVHLPSRVANSGVQYDAQGHQQTFTVDTVIIERALDSSNRPRLIINGARTPQGDLYVDGRLHTRVAVTRPDLEVG